MPGTDVALLPGVPGLVVMTMYCAPGVPATPFGTAVMILAGVAPAGLGEAITIVCLPAADCATAVPGLATAAPGVPRTLLARPLMIVAPPGNVCNTQTHNDTDRQTDTHTQTSALELMSLIYKCELDTLKRYMSLHSKMKFLGAGFDRKKQDRQTDVIKCITTHTGGSQ